MSEMLDTADTPRRARVSREEAVATTRRRRSGVLDRMSNYKLDIFDPEQLDLANYIYLWANDEGANIRRLTQLDDYDFVPTSHIRGGYNESMTDSESSDRIRILAGNKQDGSPLYVYYLMKRRAFWEADQQEAFDRRQAMMEGRVYQGSTDHEVAGVQQEDRPGGDDKYYTPKSNQLGYSGERRRGPVPRKL